MNWWIGSEKSSHALVWKSRFCLNIPLLSQLCFLYFPHNMVTLSVCRYIPLWSIKRRGSLIHSLHSKGHLDKPFLWRFLFFSLFPLSSYVLFHQNAFTNDHFSFHTKSASAQPFPLHLELFILISRWISIGSNDRPASALTFPVFRSLYHFSIAIPFSAIHLFIHPLFCFSATIHLLLLLVAILL